MELPAPPTLQCPNPRRDDKDSLVCGKALPHATHCRVCQKPFNGAPFCTHCRTYTAPLDRTTPDPKVAAEKAEWAGGTITVARPPRGCPHCGFIPNDEMLKQIGLAMAGWAEQCAMAIPKPKPPAAAPPADAFPIRVNGKVIECDQPGVDLKGRPTILTEGIMADTPRGQMLLGLLERFRKLEQERDELREALKKRK